LEQADTFDIVLYQANTVGGGITRTFTASSYDHVGMILKFEKYPEDVFILESTVNFGVHLTKFSD